MVMPTDRFVYLPLVTIRTMMSVGLHVGLLACYPTIQSKGDTK